MKQFKTSFLFLGLSLFFITQSSQSQNVATNIDKAKQTLNSIYKYYSEKNTFLLHENYPFDADFKAGYLASADTGAQKRFAYLWPFSGTFSAVNTLYKTTGDKKFLSILEKQTLVALESYFDDKRQPACYASYLKDAALSDRFYDDNVWLGIDFVELYFKTKNKKYLNKSIEIWQFILSGMDDQLGGGIYWCEQKKHSKNTCSNAPGSVMALKLFEATHDSVYFKKGLELYNWTKETLQDPDDKLYWDNKSLKGRIGKAKFPYNSGQMLQSAALLYKLTGDCKYLLEAQSLAVASMKYFTIEITENGETFRLIKPGNVWFVAVMFRGFVELYHLDKNKEYIDLFNRDLNYAWNHARNEDGLFQDNWEGKFSKKTKWLLDQAAFVEMYAAIAAIVD